MSGLLLNDNNVIPPKFPYLTWNPSPDGMPWNEMQKVQTLPNCSGPHASMKPLRKIKLRMQRMGSDQVGRSVKILGVRTGDTSQAVRQNVSVVGANPQGDTRRDTMDAGARGRERCTHLKMDMNNSSRVR